jgi:serine/threonine-protein kinase HipA
MAMSVGDSRHYKIETILGRHFIQTVERAGLPNGIAVGALEAIAGQAEDALGLVESQLPLKFPASIHKSVRNAIRERLTKV